VADEAHSTRWLILICYLLGLGIGVQLLACSASRPSPWSTTSSVTKPPRKVYLDAFVISAVILGAIQAVIIPGVGEGGGQVRTALRELTSAYRSTPATWFMQRCSSASSFGG
jgi:hypothetical protein